MGYLLSLVILVFLWVDFEDFPSVIVFSIWGPTGNFLICGKVDHFQKFTLYGQLRQSYKLFFLEIIFTEDCLADKFKKITNSIH